MTPTNVQSPIEVRLTRHDRDGYTVGGMRPRNLEMTRIDITTNQFARMGVPGNEGDALAFVRKQLQTALGEIEARMTREELAGEVALEIDGRQRNGIHYPIRYYVDTINQAEFVSQQSPYINPYMVQVLALVRKLLADKLHVPPERLNDVR